MYSLTVFSCLLRYSLYRIVYARGVLHGFLGFIRY